jgi:hypothetical protein
MMKKFACAVSILLLLSVYARAQEPAADNAPRILLCVESRTDPLYTEAEIRIVGKSIAFALKAAAERIMIVEYGQGDFPSTPDGRRAVCELLRTDGWLWIGLSGEKTLPVLQVSAYNAVSGISIIEDSFHRGSSLSSGDMSEEKWQEFVPIVAKEFGSIDSTRSSREESKTASLILRGLPGTLITGLPGSPLVVGPEGAVTPSLTVPGVFSIRAGLFGFYPSNLNVYFVADREIILVQEPGSRWAFDLSFFNSLFPGGNAAFFILPNWVFAKLEAMTYLFGLQLGPENVIFSIPLFNFGVGFGTYLAPEDFPARPYIVAGGFLRMSWLPGFAPGIEPLSPGGLSFDVGMELPITRKFALFAEYVPLLYFTAVPDLFLASLGPGENSFGYFISPLGAFSFLNMRFGIRWLL